MRRVGVQVSGQDRECGPLWVPAALPGSVRGGLFSQRGQSRPSPCAAPHTARLPALPPFRLCPPPRRLAPWQARGGGVQGSRQAELPDD